ncbi:peptidoglycan-binding protein [Embleya sp. NPDC020886]|uniref:peptidoglycan-binding protein n=1 Tax=Embleya sp. NPDC020886 TaxID=3363980 RepID=UPI00379D2B5E
MRRRVASAVVAAVVAVSGGAVAAYSLEDGKGDRGHEQAGPLPQAVADVTRGDMNAAVQAPGRLGFARGQKVGSGGDGVLTWLPEAGAEVGRGGKLYALDAEPVHLMYGATPVYREMKAGDEGEDVGQLKQNLKALGFGPQLAADDEFTPGTVKAVKAWQKAVGLEQTGTVGPGEVVFAPGPLRVDTSEAQVGDRLVPGKTVYSASGAARLVEVDLKVSEAGQRKPGDKVTVQLPGGVSVPGRVSSVGASAEAPQGGQGGGQGSGGGSDPKIKVTVEFDDPAQVRGVDQAPVTVLFAGRSRTGVLSVPVEALVALPGRGFGVQVVENGRVRDLPVTLGLFADGRVEVSGDGLAEGLDVVVPT